MAVPPSDTLRVAATRMVREHDLDAEGRDSLRTLVGEVERSWYGVRADSVFVPKGEWAKHERGLNVLIEPRYTAGTGTAYNQNFVRLEPR